MKFFELPFAKITTAIFALGITAKGIDYLDINTATFFSESENKVIISAMATEEPQETTKEIPTEAEEEVEPIICETSETMLAIIEDERKLISVKKDELDQAQSKLELAEARVQVELKNLSELRDEIKSLIQKTEDLYTSDVDRLVTLYKNMKPKDAARLLNDIDPEVAVMVLGTMPERNAAPIFAKMDIIRAQAISKIILERSKMPGDQKLKFIKLN